MSNTPTTHGPQPLTGNVTLVSLSPWSEDQFREAVGPDTAQVQITIEVAPPDPGPDELRALLSRADLVIGDGRHKTQVQRSTLEAMTRCRLIQQPAVGFDSIDHRAAADCGIPVANAAGYNRDSVADLVLMQMLNLIRHGADGDRLMRRGGWSPPGEGRELGAMTVGIVGLGNVGNAVAQRLRGFGSRILFTDPIPRSLPGAEALPLDELLRRADIVTVHVPLDTETRRLIGRDQLASMRPGSFLLNASRGPVVDEAALIEHLQSGHLGGAALDVFEVEPLPEGSPLRELDNVFLTAHVGGNTREARERSKRVVATNLRRVIQGLEPFNVVNGVSFRR
ncbi:MAG: 2-hydroxyacid dehydrogenase [Candidatus Dormibacteraeota bacterium]|nr:2-hydroxyacid dehydrogenase [Candidatus Dormibacteraeota bacterium]